MSDFKQKLKKVFPTGSSFKRFPQRAALKPIRVLTPAFVEEAQPLLVDLRAQIKEEIGGDENVTEAEKTMLYCKFGLYAVDDTGNQIVTESYVTPERKTWKPWPKKQQNLQTQNSQV